MAYLRLVSSRYLNFTLSSLPSFVMKSTMKLAGLVDGGLVEVEVHANLG